MRSFIFLSALAFISVLTPKTATSTPTNTNALTQEHPPQDEGLIIDTFQNPTFNNLGLWHGAGEDLPIKYGTDHVRLFPSDPDHNYHTLISSAQSCSGLVSYKEKGMVLRVVFSGTDRFSISLNQHNRDCDSKTRPYPETWDSVEARRYIYTFPVAAGDDERKKEIYVPLDHFKIDHWRVSSVSFNGFYNTSSPTGDSQMSTTLTLYEVSIVTPPASFTPPPKLPTGNMVLRCTRPNSFAFGIDDGQPGLAREVMQILEEEGVLVTFFVVGAGLRDPETNFTGVYTEMLRRGHQVALHSWSHPKLEGLTKIEEIDEQTTKSIETFQETLGIQSRYFRPPFGTIGARSRQRLSWFLRDPYIVNWSVDIEDWLWADTDTPEKQLEAFIRDVERGGNLAVLHYLSPSTVAYFRDAIQFVKRKGLDIMRVDQCVGDPDAPVSGL